MRFCILDIHKQSDLTCYFLTVAVSTVDSDEMSKYTKPVANTVSLTEMSM